MARLDMNPQRQIALTLALIFGFFSIAVAVTLLITYVQESRQGILSEKIVPRLKQDLYANPGNEKVRQQIRQLDVELRRDYFFNRSRFEWAAWMLAVSLPLALLFARLYIRLAPKRTRPFTREEAQAREVLRKTNKRRAITAVYALGGFCIIAMAYAGVFKSPALPPPAGAKTSAALAASATTATLANAATATSATQVVAAADTWPNFRGPGNIGIAGEGKWPAEWSVAVAPESANTTATAGATPAPTTAATSATATAAVDKNILWKTEVPMEGRSSPIVWGKRIFLTGATKQEHDVFAFDADSGKLLWTAKLASSPAATKAEIPDMTGFAASSPATDGKNVYAIFATGLLAAVDFSGKPLWQKDLGVPTSTYGFASSLLMSNGLLILQFDQGTSADENLSELRAYDPATGNLKWSIPRSVPNSWSSPALIVANGRKELITCGAPLVIAYDPASGKELWTATGLSGDVAVSPAYGAGMIFVTNDGAQLMAIRSGGSGDVTATHVAWTVKQGMPDICSPVSDGKYIFQAGMGGYLTCFNVADGKLAWEQRLETGGSASPILAGGKIYLCAEDGSTRIFELGGSYKLLSQNQIGEKIEATPAFASSRIYIRGTKHLFCIGGDNRVE